MGKCIQNKKNEKCTSKVTSAELMLEWSRLEAGVKYKHLNAISKRQGPQCDFAMMTDNLSTHNLHTTIQHVEILYDIFLSH